MSEIDYFARQRDVLIQQLISLYPSLFGPILDGSLTLSRNPVELGDGGSVTLSFTPLNNPVTIRLNGAVIGGSPQILYPPTGGWTNPTAETVTLFDVNGTQTDSETVTITPRVPIFAGLSASAVPTAPETIAASYKALDSDHIARTFVLDISAGGHPFIIFPAALTVANLLLNGLTATGWVVSDPYDLVLATGASASMRRLVLDAYPAAAGVTLGVSLT